MNAVVQHFLTDKSHGVHKTRTSVIGSPDGRVGWVLDRSRDIPRDRLAAAREILAFNGYDLTRLQETDP